MTVRDSRNRRVPSLYVRNGRYYGQLWVEQGDHKKTARRFPLLKNDGVAERGEGGEGGEGGAARAVGGRRPDQRARDGRFCQHRAADLRRLRRDLSWS